MITHKGRTMSLKEWSRELGIPATTLYSRINRGVTGEDVLGITSREELL